MLKAREQSATNLAPIQNRKRSRIQRVALYCTRNRPTNKRDVRDVFGVRFDSTTDETVLTAVDCPGKPVETARETCQIDIDQLSEDEWKRLQPLLWLELESLFDKHRVSPVRQKPFKPTRKEKGNGVFGVSLNTLIHRDQQVFTGKDTTVTLVPLVLQVILSELAVRGAREEGILRVSGNKQRIDALYNEIEHNFYRKPEKIDPLIKEAGVHDLSSLLKRWLRDLSQPLLTNDLVHLFLQTNGKLRADFSSRESLTSELTDEFSITFPLVLPPHDQCKALTVLCQLLPHENRNTLRALLHFFRRVVEQQHLNRMSQHNVATIIAPSFFPPTFVHPPDHKDDMGAQTQMAAQCCQLTNVLLGMADSLWVVPQRLIEQGKIVIAM
ncbi:rho GTPase-activating protein conundrum-like [Anopheles stephensi]|uniref:rho GTPase-activating protein conundrum-like n=1 Tax=Anopheles stephensi TaxID=30069 RepID=UPI001658B131|nr:rho GTPase-activating protein conundrum-like [Anopheles stephensi]